MKASIRYQDTQKANNQGYPVYLILRCAGQKPVKKTMFRCLPGHWNFADEIITKQHPDYDLLIADLLNTKSVISHINHGRYSYAEAKEQLFGERLAVVDDFYKAAQRLVTDDKTGELNGVVLNSFRMVHPGIGISGIEKQHAVSYLEVILRHQTPNGAHAYMRTLNAIFSKVSDLPNPFSGVRPKLQDTDDKDLSALDIYRLYSTMSYKHKYDARNDNFTVNHYKYYYLLMFLLGGIDMFDLAKLRYDKHIVGGRLQFKRGKGGTSALVNNVIVDEAKAILDIFDCKPYLVPIYKKKHHSFVTNMNDRFTARTLDLNLTRRPLTKSARYTFINLAQDLLIDERITGQLVGHKSKTTTGIYTRNFALPVVDEAHRSIVASALVAPMAENGFFADL